MKIEKEKKKVDVLCNDGSWIKGFIYVNPGIRVSDFINDSRENFIILTNVEFYMREPTSSETDPKPISKTDMILLNKSVIKLIKETKA